MQQAVELLKEWGAYRLATHWEQQYEHLLRNKQVTQKSEVLVPFDMHYRASNNKISNSNGIGLAICKKIMTQHKGEIFIESTEGVGSRFSISIAVE